MRCISFRLLLCDLLCLFFVVVLVQSAFRAVIFGKSCKSECDCQFSVQLRRWDVLFRFILHTCCVERLNSIFLMKFDGNTGREVYGKFEEFSGGIIGFWS